VHFGLQPVRMSRMGITVAEWRTYGGWHGNREVTSAADAREVCTEIESHADAGRVLVGFAAPSGDFFALGLGHERSCLMYWASAERPYLQSRGIDQGKPLDFAYDGQHTEVPAPSLISRDAALRALTEFVETGHRPESVDWQET
jgi:hypothetical protein